MYVFVRERLKVEPIARVVVGRDGLRVAVDHDGLKPGVGEREACVHTAVVELDALANSVWTRAEDHDLLTIRRPNLRGVFPCGVVIRRFGVELGTAGVDGLVGRCYTCRLTSRAHVVLRDGPQVGDLCVGEAELLGSLPLAFAHLLDRVCFDRLALFGNAKHLVEVPRVDIGLFVHLFDRLATPETRFEFEDPIWGWNVGLVEELIEIHRVIGGFARITVETEASVLEATKALLE